MRALRAVMLAALGCSASAPPPPPPSTQCGAGTLLQDGECIAVPPCGAGTHDEAGTCVRDSGAFLIRARSQLVADGAANEVVVVGSGQVVLSTDRPGAGEFVPPTLTLDERAAVAQFKPCRANVAGCLGPLGLTVARAEDPATPVARIDIELVATPVIGPVEHCQGPGNILYLDGGGFMYTGKLTVTDATFTVTGGTRRSVITVAPAAAIQGTSWSLDFNTVQLGADMVPGIYRGAAQFPGVGSPGLNITGQTPFSACRFSTGGEFQILEYTATPPRLTAGFRDICSDYPQPVVSGCIHVE